MFVYFIEFKFYMECHLPHAIRKEEMVAGNNKMYFWDFLQGMVLWEATHEMKGSSFILLDLTTPENGVPTLTYTVPSRGAHI